MKLISWNVNGLRSIFKKGFLEFLEEHQPDLICLQETKISSEQIAELALCPPNYELFHSGAVKKGYSGVLTYVHQRHVPDLCPPRTGIGIEPFDAEGRFVISEHGMSTNSAFTLYNAYFPSGTTGEVRQDFKYKFLEAFFEHLQSLPKAKRDKTVICGDFNICHREPDIHHPDKATKLGLSGFLPDERKWMDQLTELGFVDTYRFIHGPERREYSWWTFRAGARSKNLGWRIDYFFVANALVPRVKNAQLLTTVMGSDHCPILLDLET